MKARHRILSLSFSVLLLTMLLLTTGHGTLGQGKTTGTINCHFSLADKSIHGQPVMVSAIRDGEVVDQQEMKLPYDGRLWGNIQQGVYDVRVEGDGIVSEVKRGVRVFAERELNLTFVIKPGRGVHIVEYATGGLAREEVAARLQKLEAAVEELRKAKQ